ncbi:MAG TPA: hypothetical protein VIU64_09385 [Polyangia bacterium]
MPKYLYNVTAPATLVAVVEAKNEEEATDKAVASMRSIFAGALGAITIVGDPKVTPVATKAKSSDDDDKKSKKEEEEDGEEEEEEDEDGEEEEEEEEEESEEEEEEEEEEKPSKKSDKSDKKSGKSDKSDDAGKKIKIKLKPGKK